jgi:hypothetical protein
MRGLRREVRNYGREMIYLQDNFDFSIPTKDKSGKAKQN